MAFWDKLAGTMLSVFKFGGPSGPQIKNTAGVLAARDTTDANYAPFEADLRHLGQAPQTINDLTELNPADPAVDFIPVWDVTAGATRKVKPNNLGVTGGGATPYIIEPAQITGSVDDYNPTDLNICTGMRLTSDATRFVRSIVPRADGTVLSVENIGAFDIVLLHNGGSGSAENRFYCPGEVDFYIPPNSGVQIIYEDNSDTTSRWRVLGFEAVAGGSGLTHPQVLARTLGA